MKLFISPIALFLLAISAGIIVACGDGEDGPKRSSLGVLSGGATTIEDASSHAFSNPAPNLNAQNLALHLDGDVAFESAFVTAPSINNPGLGPIFNETSCAACHARDGRGSPVENGPMAPLLIRLSIPGQGPHGGPNPVPGFGGQLQDRANFGVAPEANASIQYQEIPGAYGDGTPYTLLAPTYTLSNPYIPIPNEMLVSPRIGPAVFGLGLLEALSDDTILAQEDPNDLNGDGISGRANMVWDHQAQATVIGKFGWKAGQPHLLQQSAAAYLDDMGITTSYFPTEAAAGQAQDDQSGDDPELPDSELQATTMYVQTLAVPARRNINDPLVLQGERLFNQAGCASCHTPTLTTGDTHEIPALRNQTLHPFTDMLLHDMGEGLADNRPEFLANGREWRTAPLWGLGLLPVVNGHMRLLHDGRARGFAEAILWHGGEAEASKEFFRTLSASEREALIKFLESN